ncbi:Flavin prenyltransferase UbiX [Fundidesulfovibrio magnetotacticus]|uniref:Flavin prenyltransferase UbiX n=1 Tax=Fundidesulfovibrio magnetotacticus TaxID=2730080 RepID=A0A6V8M1Q6_9BACT|nr:UbiX family flavin prenyltransferase [Fundidesulfovibrio magnetotacticus]GFK96129.1 Flavin prenyltransferase UbiX [Fundidesulfovibrio magnetotacticus]
MKRLVVGISGASGVVYGVRLLEVLRAIPDLETHLVMSQGARLTLRLETERELDDVLSLAHVVHDPSNLAASISSGSFRTLGMAVVPCSMKSLAQIALSLNDNLLTRAADVALKERRKLVIVPRETPLHLGHLRHMTAVAEMGGVILPPAPSFYHGPQTIMDIVDQTVGKVLDQFGLEHDLFRRWSGHDA